jgi:hypothetical protein
MSKQETAGQEGKGVILAGNYWDGGLTHGAGVGIACLYGACLGGRLRSLSGQGLELLVQLVVFAFVIGHLPAIQIDLLFEQGYLLLGPDQFVFQVIAVGFEVFNFS